MTKLKSNYHVLLKARRLWRKTEDESFGNGV